MKRTAGSDVCREESFKWYLAGRTAITQFEQEIQDKCKAALQKHLAALAQALGVSETDLEIGRYSSSAEIRRAPVGKGYVELGAKAKHRRRGQEFSAHVWWSAERSKVEQWEKHPHGVQTSVSCKDKSQMDRLYEALDRNVPSRWSSSEPGTGTAWCWNEIPLARMPQFEKDLDALVADTIKVIRRSGAFRKRKPRAK